jgi:hypothetical protein
MNTMTEDTRPVDAFGVPIERGAAVAPLGDPTRPGVVVSADEDGLLMVRNGPAVAPTRAHQVRVVTMRDARGVVLAPGDIVQGVDDAGEDRPTRIVDRVLYGPGLVVLAADNVHGPQTSTLPALLVRVGAALREGDEVVDRLSGALLVVLGPGRRPGTVLAEPVFGGARRDVERAELRRTVGVEDGVEVAPDGRWAVPAVGDDPGAVGAVERLLGLKGGGNVVPFPRAAGR